MEYPSEFGTMHVSGGGHSSSKQQGKRPPPISSAGPASVPKKKKRKVAQGDDKGVKHLGKQQGGFIGSASDVCATISSSIARCVANRKGRAEPQGPAMATELWDDNDDDAEYENVELCSILRGVNYLETFYRIFGSCPEMHPQQGGSKILNIGRATEEEFMREPIHSDERKCINGALCHCMTIDPEMPFVGVEFVCPWESRDGPQQMCVLCHRAIVQEMLYSIIGPGNPVQPVIQRYGNLCGIPGEYKESACNTSVAFGNPAVMPLPLAVHQKSAYRVERINGYKHIKQDPTFYFF